MAAQPEVNVAGHCDGHETFVVFYVSFQLSNYWKWMNLTATWIESNSNFRSPWQSTWTFAQPKLSVQHWNVWLNKRSDISVRTDLTPQRLFFALSLVRGLAYCSMLPPFETVTWCLSTSTVAKNSWRGRPWPPRHRETRTGVVTHWNQTPSARPFTAQKKQQHQHQKFTVFHQTQCTIHSS